VELLRKSVKQGFFPSSKVLAVVECFRQMTNDCVRIGLELERRGHPMTSKQTLANLVYQELRRRYGGYSGYTLGAISRATGILSARSKSIRRGFPTKTPYAKRPTLLSCYGFKIRDGSLVIHIDAKTFESIPLNSHTRELLSSNTEVRVRSFTLSENSLSLCISKVIEEKEAEKKPSWSHGNR
jgi:putative transposase